MVIVIISGLTRIVVQQNTDRDITIIYPIGKIIPIAFLVLPGGRLKGIVANIEKHAQCNPHPIPTSIRVMVAQNPNFGQGYHLMTCIHSRIRAIITFNWILRPRPVPIGAGPVPPHHPGGITAAILRINTERAASGICQLQLSEPSRSGCAVCKTKSFRIESAIGIHHFLPGDIRLIGKYIIGGKRPIEQRSGSIRRKSNCNLIVHRFHPHLGIRAPPLHGRRCGIVNPVNVVKEQLAVFLFKPQRKRP